MNRKNYKIIASHSNNPHRCFLRASQDNPVGFVKANEDFSPVKDISEVRMQWGSSDGAVKANVFIRDELFAILVDGEKPGWSILATKNGPLAKVLER